MTDSTLLMIESQKDRLTKNLSSAIKIMRDACDEAEQSVSELGACSQSIEQVNSALSWGLANASTRIGSAMSSLHEINTLTSTKNSNYQ